MDNLVPQSKELEEALLGALLINPEMYAEVGYLSTQDFYLRKHQWLWQAITKLHQQARSFDFVTVTEELARQGKLEELGGPAYLSALINNTYLSYQAPQYAAQVRALAIRRQLINSANEIAKLAYDQNKTIDEIQQEAAHLTRYTPGQEEIYSIGAWAQLAYDTMLYRREHGLAFLGTGLPDLDTRIDGLDPSEATMLLLCGEPGAGKTILWGQIAFHLATQDPGFLLSMEMSGRRMLYRVLADRTKISALKMRRGQVTEEETDRIWQEVIDLDKTPLHLGNKRHTPESLHARLVQLKRDEGITWYGLDYLTLMGGYNKLEKWQRAEVLSQDLLQINRELGLCSLVIHTLNASGQVAGGKGAQYDADVICTLMNDPDARSNPDMDAKRLTFQKIRDSETGTSPISLLKHKARPRFESVVANHVSFDEKWYQK